MKRLVTFGLLASLVGLAHCGGGEGGSRASADGQMTGADGGPSTTASGADGAGDGGGATRVNAVSDGGTPDAGCTTTDEPDDEGVDSNCDGADGVVGRDVYVSALGNDTNIGSPDAPVRSLAIAADRAEKRGGAVLVTSGQYAMSTLTLPAGSKVFGGYSAKFLGAPKRELTVLQAGPTGLLLDGAGSATLAHLTIAGSDAAAAARMAYALRSRVVALTLDDVIVRAASALGGTAGTPGADGEQGRNDAQVTVCGSKAQPTWTAGCSSAAGCYDANLPAGDVATKRRAAPGKTGASGADGPSGRGVFTLVDGLLGLDVGQAGRNDGEPGYGAGWGGSGSWTGRFGPESFKGGTGGSGGCPGAGGTGGTSGGASVAVLVLQGQVTLRRCSLETGFGGDGGAGGAGGSGGNGGYGGSPALFDGVWVKGPLFADNICTDSSKDPMQLDCAAFGGIGGRGGNGGHGGGGAGGSTIGLVTAKGATATYDASTVFALGNPGVGGSNGGNARAPNGRKTPLVQAE